MKKTNAFLNKYIKGLALTPFYIFTALLVSSLPIYIWLFIVVVLLFVSGSIYDAFIDIEYKNIRQLLFRYIIIIALQLMMAAAVFFI